MRVFLESRLNAHRARFARYVNDDEDGGTTTIEFVLWLPIFILILSLVIDVCFVFLGQAVMYDVASDAARRASICQDIAATQTYAEQKAEFLGATPTVTITDPPVNGAYTVTIQHNLEDIDVVGILGFLASDTISAVVTQLSEGTCY